MTIPVIVLLMELGVANAYLGLLLSSHKDFRHSYLDFMLLNATTILFGLMVSLIWLILYRCRLSWERRERRAKRREDRMRKASISEEDGEEGHDEDEDENEEQE